MANTWNEEDEKMFEGAFNSFLHMDKKDYPAYVGGLMVASGNEFTVSSPVDKSIMFGRFQDPEDDLPDKAVIAAQTAFEEWSKTDAAKRIGIFEIVLDNIERQRFRFAAAVMICAGMTKLRAMEEVNEFIVTLKKVIKEAKDLKGKPMGVWAVVSEYNTPFASPASYAAAAMLAGNTVVMIPSKYTPVPMFMFYDVLKNASLPPGVLNLIVGRRKKMTSTLVNNEDIVGIAASGSGERMEEMMFIQANDELRFVNGIKGMNPILIYKPKNMVHAAEAIVKDAFSFSGQDIHACSKVIVTADEQKPFMDAVLKACSKISVGDPIEDETNVGPIISESKMDEFLEIAKKLKDHVTYGGSVAKVESADGYYVKPMILTGLKDDHEMNNIDHSLPILSIQSANDIEEAVELINDCEFGLYTGIYSRDDDIVKMFEETAVADHAYVNERTLRPTVSLKTFVK